MVEKLRRTQHCDLLYILNLTLDHMLVGGVDEANSKVTYSTSCMKGHRPALPTLSLVDQSSRGPRRRWQPQAASGGQFLCLVPGALTTWDQEAKRRTPLCSPATGHAAHSRQGGTCWSFCGMVSPPTDEWANRCLLLSPEELLPFLPGGVRTFPLTLPEHGRSRSPLVSRLRQGFSSSGLQGLGETVGFPPGTPGGWRPAFHTRGCVPWLSGRLHADCTLALEAGC